MNETSNSHQADTISSRLRSYYLIWAVLGVAVVAAAALGFWTHRYSQAHLREIPGVQILATPEAAPSFTLMDQHREHFTQIQLLGKWTLMFFGYTHCPDFCPTTLNALNSAYRRLERQNVQLASHTQIVFVSVDPFRDSPPVLTDFIDHFNSKFIGVTGPPAQLHRLTDPLGASYDYSDPVNGNLLGDTMQQPQQNYTVDHGSGIYIFDEHAQVVAWVLPPHTADRILSIYNAIRKQYE